MKLNEVKKKTPDGSFAGVKFDKETTDAVLAFIKENNIPEGLRASQMHATLLYSKKYLPDYESAGKLEKPLVGKFSGFEIFESSSDIDGKKTNCLVLRFNCPKLSARHKSLMKEHEATYDYDTYKPHVTLTYNAGQLDPDKLPKFDKDLVITEEYGEDLNDDWTQCKKS